MNLAAAVFSAVGCWLASSIKSVSCSVSVTVVFCLRFLNWHASEKGLGDKVLFGDMDNFVLNQVWQNRHCNFPY